MKRLVVSLFLFISLTAESAFAASGSGVPYYGGIELFSTRSEQVSAKDLVNTAEFFIEDNKYGTVEDQRRLTFEDVGHGKRLYMGVSSADDWDWEWGYIDFGKSHGGYSSQSVSMKTDVKSEGWFLGFQYSPQISERWEANLKLGLLRWDGSRYSRMLATREQAVDRYETVSGIDEYYGAGLLYTVNERWKIRFDMNRHMLGDDQLDTFGIAAQFWFNGRLINNVFDY